MMIWTLLKLNTFSSIKGTVMRIKRETIGLEKIFVEHISVKGLTYIFIKFLQLNEKTIQFKNEQRI